MACQSQLFVDYRPTTYVTKRLLKQTSQREIPRAKSSQPLGCDNNMPFELLLSFSRETRNPMKRKQTHLTSIRINVGCQRVGVHNQRICKYFPTHRSWRAGK